MKLFSLIVCICISIALCGCGSHGQRGTGEILDELISKAGDLPDGEIYFKDAEEGESGYLPHEVREAMYGEGHEGYFSMLEDYSIYLASFMAPYEIGVFKCYSGTDAMKIEIMCKQRRDLVSVALRETQFYGLCDNVRILRSGRYVIFIMTEDPDTLLRVSKKLI